MNLDRQHQLLLVVSFRKPFSGYSCHFSHISTCLGSQSHPCKDAIVIQVFCVVNQQQALGKKK